ncbi:hypothetical protein cyc_02877 [Cyclospora cayetanensis]|uniref:Uncharacterized protein n=1 Tax=Cyclospora cayetanensis TaxID=88456 RepID=A0A1D3D1N4_9EIME|nr:hypothetical protein cyc_02877 [Cyclospora cayetanensis]
MGGAASAVIPLRIYSGYLRAHIQLFLELVDAGKNLPSCFPSHRDFTSLLQPALTTEPISVRILIVLTLDQSNPNFETVEEGLQLRADESPKEAITGIGMFVAHFAVLLLEGAYRPVMDCVRWLDQLEATRQILDGTVIFFSDYRTYKLMPSYWSFRPKDFLDMRFDEGDIELTEEAVAQQATSLYEKMVLLIHELRSTNLEARLDPTGLLAKEFVKFAPDPRVVHALLSASITKNLLFSLGEFKAYFLDDFLATLPRDMCI